MLLQVKDIITYYGKARALNDVSLDLDEGEIVALLGANGAGKTTTLMTISGLIRPRSGQVLYRDENIAHISPSAIVKKGLVHCPEGRFLFPDMTVRDNLILGAYSRYNRKKITKELERIYIHFPRLRERLSQQSGSLSGGEQQMLAIGRALMSNPKLLMLDEPSLGLSPLLVQELFKIISNIRKEGVSILLVEQIVAASLDVADRAFILENGRIFYSGTQEELMQSDHIKNAYLG